MAFSHCDFLVVGGSSVVRFMVASCAFSEEVILNEERTSEEEKMKIIEGQ